MTKDNERYTTYISEDQLKTLRNLSDATGEKINRLIGEALDDFFVRTGIWQDEERTYVPLDKDYLEKFYREKKESESE